ncbi:hypothetical protein [Nocardia brasiliensis]|uniref:hypothetical protein n=1 Tax=Nocardia brasiliensis TaxID=37326 RepID=UPI002456A578|nr:hypothetical protein [Nocardia brasiliensis]
MSFADDLRVSKHQPDPRSKCGTGEWLKTLDADDRAAFEAFLADGGTVTVLHRNARQWGLDLEYARFRVHCRRGCSCYRNEGIAA